MSKRFKIYSAARADDGRYCFSWDERMYIKEFPDLPSMLQFWRDVILPSSCTRFGMRYEMSMTEFSGADWDFIGDPRYADHPVLNGKRKDLYKEQYRRLKMKYIPLLFVLLAGCAVPMDELIKEAKECVDHSTNEMGIIGASDEQRMACWADVNIRLDVPTGWEEGVIFESSEWLN
jgi:hypothetical protein